MTIKRCRYNGIQELKGLTSFDVKFKSDNTRKAKSGVLIEL